MNTCFYCGAGREVYNVQSGDICLNLALSRCICLCSSLALSVEGLYLQSCEEERAVWLCADHVACLHHMITMVCFENGSLSLSLNLTQLFYFNLDEKWETG